MYTTAASNNNNNSALPQYLIKISSHSWYDLAYLSYFVKADFFVQNESK